MVFLNSLKLFGSNWKKALKLFLYYVVVWGISIALFLPAFFAFRDLIVNNFHSYDLSHSLAGVFGGTLGENLQNVINFIFFTLKDVFVANAGMAVYGTIVLFVVLPFFANVGKYAFNQTLYSYMTSNNQVGFFSALIKTLGKAIIFAIAKTLYNVIFLVCGYAAVLGVALVEDPFFVKYFLPIVEFVLLVLLFTLNQIFVLGWSASIIVFDCGVCKAYRKGLKAAFRHFWKTFGIAALYFAMFWALVLIFGIYTMTILVPLATVLISVYDMTIFFTSQGMRFYVNKTQIMTPKKLEEVDNINKTAFIL